MSKRAQRGSKRAASPAPEADAASVPAAAASSSSSSSAAAAAPASKKARKGAAAKEAAASSSSAAAAAAASSAASSSASDSDAAAAGAAPLAAALALSGLDRVPAGATGSVFAFGSGDCSQLGLGAEENMRERKKPTALKALAGQSIAAIAAGSLHNLVLTAAPAKGAVLAWGCNDDHALGHTKDEWLATPVDGPLGQGDSAELPGGVVQIACGASHSIALSATGDVYSWGTYRDANGVIGFSETIDAATRPHHLSALPKGTQVVQIAAGEHHDLLLTTAGDVYQWGDIGIGKRMSDRRKKSKLNPSRVVFKKNAGVAPPKRFEQVFAGGHSNFALDAQGTAWFWGPNNYNQGGRANPDKESLMILIPEPVKGLPPLRKVAAATHHTLFLTRDGQVYSCGRGEDGRLGHGDSKNYEAPKLIESLSSLPHGDRIVDVNCGECHSLVTSSQGRLYSFGYGDLLQLGNGVEEDVPKPYCLQSKEIDEMGAAGCGRAVVQAAGGAQHSIILTIERTKPAPWAAAKADAGAAAPAAAAAASSSSAAAAGAQ